MDNLHKYRIHCELYFSGKKNALVKQLGVERDNIFIDKKFNQRI